MDTTAWYLRETLSSLKQWAFPPLPCSLTFWFCYCFAVCLLFRFNGNTHTHHGLCIKNKEARQVIMTGRQVLLCLRFAAILAVIWVLLYFLFGLELREKMLLWAKWFSQQNTPSTCYSWVTTVSVQVLNNNSKVPSHDLNSKCSMSDKIQQWLHQIKSMSKSHTVDLEVHPI